MEGVGREGCLPGPGSGLVSDQWMGAGAAVFLAAGPAPPSWLAVHGEYGTASRVREPGGGQAAAGGGFHGRGAGGVSAVPVAVHDRGRPGRARPGRFGGDQGRRVGDRCASAGADRRGGDGRGARRGREENSGGGGFIKKKKK